MASFLASYRNEWDKLISRKKYIVFIFIGVGLCLVWTALGQLLSNFARQRIDFSMTLAPTPMGVLPFFLQFLIPFLMFMGITDLVTVEGAENTMKAMIYRPVERWKLFTSKIIAVVTYAAVYLASLFVISTMLNQFFGRSLSVNDLLVALASYALTLIPLAILASYAAVISLLGRSGTLVMFILLVSYLALSALPIIYPVLSEMLFTSYLSWYRLWIGALPGATKLIHMVLIVFAYGAVFFTAGSLLFDRKGY